VDSTAKFLLAVLILLPFDYGIIKFVDVIIYRLKNNSNKEKKINEIDKDFWGKDKKKDIDFL